MERKVFVNVTEILSSNEFVEEIKRTTTLNYQDVVVVKETEKKNDAIQLRDPYRVAERLVNEKLFKSLRYYTYTNEYFLYFELLGHYAQLNRDTLCGVIKKYLSTQFAELPLKANYLMDLAKELSFQLKTQDYPEFDDNCWVLLNGVLSYDESTGEFKFGEHSDKYFVIGKLSYNFVEIPEQDEPENAPIFKNYLNKILGKDVNKKLNPEKHVSSDLELYKRFSLETNSLKEWFKNYVVQTSINKGLFLAQNKDKTKPSLYKNYEHWCLENDLALVSVKEFSFRLPFLLNNAGIKYLRKRKTPGLFIYGVDLKEPTLLADTSEIIDVLPEEEKQEAPFETVVLEESKELPSETVVPEESKELPSETVVPEESKELPGVVIKKQGRGRPRKTGTDSTKEEERKFSEKRSRGRPRKSFKES